MMMVVLELANQFLSTLRIGGIMEQVRLLPVQEQRRIATDIVNNEEGNDFSFRARNDPTSGTGRGGHGQTGPSTLEEQVKLVAISEKNQTTWPFAGL